MATQKKALLSARNVTKKAGPANNSVTMKPSASRDLSMARGSARKALRLAANHSLTVR